MPSGTIACGYCKEKVSRNGYGKHILSSKHKQEFLKENEKLISSWKQVKSLPSVNIKDVCCCICIVCKTFYVDKDTTSENPRYDSYNHFEKHPDCKKNFMETLKKLLQVKPPKASTEEVEKLKKQVKTLQSTISMLETNQEEMEKENTLMTKMLSKLFPGFYLDEMESKIQDMESKSLLPLNQ